MAIRDHVDLPRVQVGIAMERADDLGADDARGRLRLDDNVVLHPGHSLDVSHPPLGSVLLVLAFDSAGQSHEAVPHDGIDLSRDDAARSP